MKRYRPLLVAGALSALVLAGCEDVPFVPKWDAEWTLPLPTTTIRIGDFFPGAVILPGVSADVSFDPEKQTLDAAIGDVLDQNVTRIILSLTYTSTLPLVGADTLFIAPDSAGLFTATASRISLSFSLAQTGAQGLEVAQTLTQAQRETIQNAAELWVQLRGSLRNPGASPVVLTGAETISLKLAMTITVGVSTR